MCHQLYSTQSDPGGGRGGLQLWLRLQMARLGTLVVGLVIVGFGLYTTLFTANLMREAVAPRSCELEQPHGQRAFAVGPVHCNGKRDRCAIRSPYEAQVTRYA